MNTLRNKLFYGVAICVLVMGASSPAVPVVTVDGYVAMGGMRLNTTNEYLLIGYPESAPVQAGPMLMQTWGFAFIGFDNLPNQLVAQAALTLQSIPQTSGMWPAPEDSPVNVELYASAIDLSQFTVGQVDGVRQTMIANSPAAMTVVSGGEGFYQWDVTDMLNDWILGGGSVPFGIFLASDGGAIPKFHSSETTTGTGPALSYTVVPEPATLAMLGLGVVGLLSRRNRRS